jgi:F-type H+-transporting ATPase subunit b
MRFIFIFLIYFVVVPIVFASGPTQAEGHINLWPFFWHVINFSLLVIILFVLTKEKLKDVFTLRRENIINTLNEAEKQKKEAEELKKLYEEKISSLEKERESILKEAENAGEKEKNKIIENAEREAKKILGQIEVVSKKEMQEAKKELNNEVSSLSLVIAEELIKKNFKKSDQIRILGDYIKNIGTL